MTGRRLAGGCATLILVLAAGGSSRAQVPEGALRGTVTDRDFGTPLAGVRVAVVEATRITTTTQAGTFLFEKLPAGQYTLILTRDGYQREVVTSVVVTGGQMAEVAASLASEVIEMEELVVAGTDLLASSEFGLLEIRQAAVNVQDALSAEVISKAGASDVAAALKFVVGTSVSEGKYATVRGLSDRYTGTTLNGVRIPSSDPRRKSAQVDLFPTGTIESLTVTKTFTPDQPGDFTGGGVDIRTRSVPEEAMGSISLSFEHNSQATHEDDFLTYQGGGANPFGYDDDRDLPEEAYEPLPALPAFSANPTPAQIEASQTYDRVVRSFEPAMGVQSSTAGVNTSFAAVGGARHDFDADTVLGVLGAYTWSHKYDFYEDAVNNNGFRTSPTEIIGLSDARSDSRGVDEVLLGGLVSVELRPRENHSLGLEIVANQAAEDSARFQVETISSSQLEQNQSLLYTERGLLSTQLRGRHEFPDVPGGGFDFDWVIASNSTRQEEPDVRFFRNRFDLETLTSERPPSSTNALNTRRIFREIDEENGQAGANFTFAIPSWSETRGRLRFGGVLDQTDRLYEQRSFTYAFPTQFSSGPDVDENRAKVRYVSPSPDVLWTDVFTDPDRIGLASNTPPAPNQLLWVLTTLSTDVDYTAEQEFGAWYGMAELPLHARWTAILGARRESTKIDVLPTNRLLGTVEVIEISETGDRAIVRVPQEEAAVHIEEADWLPAAGVIYEIRPEMKVRASWSRTLARPTFRELAPVATEEFIQGDEFTGNPDLALSRIANYDLRWEWFPAADRVLAASVFYKRLKDPIELISFAAGGRSFVQPVNYDVGRLTGAEIEFRSPLAPLAEALAGFTFGINATFLDSEVEVPIEEQISVAPFGLAEEKRRLQGQPDHLLNVSFEYANERRGTTVALFYNKNGETLLSGAARGVEDGVPNVFEQEFSTLDLSISQKVKERLTLTLRARNLLQDDRGSLYRAPDGATAVKSNRPTPLLVTLAGTWRW